MKHPKFNLIGFHRINIDTKEFRHCTIHLYKRLLEHKTDSTLLFCPECGSEFPVQIKDTTLEQDIQTEVPSTNSNQTKIISARKKRKHYDNFGTLIPEDDSIAINESLGAGFKKLIYYKKDKKGEEYHTVKK